MSTLEVALAAAGGGALFGGAAVWWWLRSRVEALAGGRANWIDDEWEVVTREFERARRYDRPFALIRLPTQAFGGESESSREMIMGVVLASVRTIDFVWIDEVGVHILLPEARRSDAESCIRRLVEADPTILPSKARVAVFPEDGVTSSALFAKLVEGARAPGVPGRVSLRSSFRVPRSQEP